MPSNAVKELMEVVTTLQIALAKVQTDVETLKKLVYLQIGVGTTIATGVIIALLTHWVR